MPWKETCRMDEKLVFVADCLRGELPMAALCGDYGISRKTGYKWLGRYREQGPEGLVERSLAPSRSVDGAGAGRGDCRSAQARPHWGPRKLRAATDGRAPRGGVACGQRWAICCGRAGERPPPAPSSCALPCRHRTQRYVWCRLQGLVPHPRRRTLRADRQRRLQPRLCHRPAPDRHGPCGGRAASSATACWPSAGRNGRGHCLVCRSIKAGIALERIEPGQPQQNGRHERMHRTLKAERNRRPRVLARISTTTVPTRRLASSRLRPSTGPRCGLTPNAWTSPGTMLGTPCAGCATGPSSGAATWSSSARR